MDDIAESIGLVKTSLYYYYNSKEELFQAVIRNESETLIGKLRAETDKHTSPQRKHRAYFITRMEYLKELVNLYHLTKAAAQELLPLAEEERRHRHVCEREQLDGGPHRLFGVGAGGEERLAVGRQALLRELPRRAVVFPHVLGVVPDE